MKKILIACMALLLSAASVSASDGSKAVAKSVLTSFTKAYSDASNVQWTVTEQFARASFILDAEKVEAYFTTDGDFIAESKAIALQELPRAGRKLLQSKYSGYQLKEVVSYTTDEKVEYYVSIESEKEKKVLRFNARGQAEVFSSSTK